MIAQTPCTQSPRPQRELLLLCRCVFFSSDGLDPSTNSPEGWRGCPGLSTVLSVCSRRERTAAVNDSNAENTSVKWTILQHNGADHLGLWRDALPGHQMALITSGCMQGSWRSAGTP